MKRDYSINEIREFYGEYINKGVKEGLFKHEGEAIRLISVLNYCGVPLTEYNIIVFLLNKAQELRHAHYDKDDYMYWLCKSDTITLMYHLIHKYYGDYKFDYEMDDVLMRRKYVIER